MRGLLRERYTITINFVPDTFAQIAALDPAVLIMDFAMGEQAGWQPFERLLVEARKTGIPMLVISTAPSLTERAQEHASQHGKLRYRG
jgi:CheY-like chemotaxis protein